MTVQRVPGVLTSVGRDQLSLCSETLWGTHGRDRVATVSVELKSKTAAMSFPSHLRGLSWEQALLEQPAQHLENRGPLAARLWP